MTTDQRLFRSLPYHFVREYRLLADVVGDVGQFPLIGRDGREIIRSADEIKCPQCFPDLLRARIDNGDLVAGGNRLSNLSRQHAQAAADRRTNLNGLRAHLQLRDDAALVDRGANTAGVDNSAGLRRSYLRLL